MLAPDGRDLANNCLIVTDFRKGLISRCLAIPIGWNSNRLDRYQSYIFTLTFNVSSSAKLRGTAGLRR